MKYYLQITPENVITDAVNYSVDGYTEYDTFSPLPAGINGGWFKFDKGVVVEHPELKPSTRDDEIQELRQILADLTSIVLGV